jgi:IclR family transcriptional regulator, mhp operon transcriptional activator
MVEKKIPQPKTIRALERGLNIMQILQTKGFATLNEIYQIAGLPRPTILRILRTLEGAGWVRRGLEDGFYRNSFKIEGMVSSLDHTDKLAEISTPYLDALCRKASWPSDLTVLNSSSQYMELKETSRSLTPFLLNRDNIGHKINLPLSAVGRAYLAFCDENECTRILAHLKKSRNLANRIIHDEEKFLNDLSKIREVGYATREPAFGGGQEPLRSEFDDGLNAIAVPIQLDKRILGCISLVWLRKAVPTQDIIERYLIDLQNAAREISNQFDK